MAEDKVVRFRCTPDDKAHIESEAAKLGISVSDFLRLLVKQWSDGIRFERKEEGQNK